MRIYKLARIFAVVVFLLVIAVGSANLNLTTVQIKNTLNPRNASVWGSSDAIGDEWPMDGGALNHTGASITTPASNIGAYWGVSASAAPGSPVVSEGYIYIGGIGEVECYDQSTSGLMWSYPTGDEDPISHVAVAGGSVFAGSEDGLLTV